MYKRGERPRCPYCGHKPFRTANGYRWHLEHIHPAEEYIPVGKVLAGDVAVMAQKARRGRRGRSVEGQMVDSLSKIVRDFKV